MLDSTISASDILGGAGAGLIAQPARKGRRSQKSGTGARVADTQGIATAEAISSQMKAGAIVEAMSDAELVELILKGNQEVFSVLVERYKDAVQNLAYRMLGN